MNRTKTETEIVICYECKGKGFKLKEELVNYHKNEYDYTKIDCTACENSGRQRKETTITLKPYK